MAGTVDSHTHLNHPRLLRRLDEVLGRAERAGVSEMLVVGYDLPSSDLAAELAERDPRLWAAVGVHPHDAGHLDDACLVHLRSLATRERVVAIGETGLDFYRDLSPREAQVEALKRHLALAQELSLPVVLHCRQAQEEMLEVAAEFAGLPMIWHCFQGTGEQAACAVALGMMIGFAGTITYGREEALRRTAAAIPESRLLIETDCPYLPPEPKRDRDNEPANVTVIADHLAKARGSCAEAMVHVTADNARRVLRLPRGGA